MQFHHIGIVAANLAEGRAALADLIEVKRWMQEFTDPANRVHLQFGLDSSGVCYELVAPAEMDSPIANALTTGKHILNHVAYVVPHLTMAQQRMQAAGARPTSDPHPGIAYGGARIQFFITRFRLLIELIETPKHGLTFNHFYQDEPSM